MGIINNVICGTCEWEIDEEKTLTIRPRNGKSGVLHKDCEDDCWPWQSYSFIKKAVIAKGVSTGRFAGGMFAGMKDCVEIDVEWLDLSAAENMCSMFAGCRSLTSVKGVEKWDVSKARCMSYMFLDCESLTDISPLAGWDVSRAVNMRSAFLGCKSLTDISALAEWDVSEVVYMPGMFGDCRSLTDISPLRGWDVSGVVDMNHMFCECTHLTDISALAGWDISKASNTSGMFEDCDSLKDISPLETWDVSNVIYAHNMFAGCRQLTDISPLSLWDMSSVRDATEMFCDTGVSRDAYYALIPMTCPREGAFVGYKKCEGGRIVQLEIPEDAERSSAYGKKCRCSKAGVLHIWTPDGGEADYAVSGFDPDFIYRRGEIAEVEDFDDYRFNECSTGIHFFMTREEAAGYIV